MDIRFVRGDLIQMAEDGEFTVVAHGANCFHTMGSGIAPQINKLSGGELLKADKKTPIGDINKLGTFSMVEREINGEEVEMYNLYTQYNYGSVHGVKNPVLVNWQAVHDSIFAMIEHSDNPEKIGIPLIGCGLAGGTIECFMEVMDQLKEGPYGTVDGIEIVVVEYKKS